MQDLIREADRENGKWHVRHRFNLALLIFILLFWVGKWIVGFPTRHVPSSYEHFVFLGLLFVFGSEGFGLLTRPIRQHWQVMHSLTEGKDTALVGPLLEAKEAAWFAGTHLFGSDKKLYFAVIAALTRLLPQMSEAEYRTLTPAQKKVLYRMLKAEHMEVVRPALEIVTRMGDSSALPILERLARGKGDSPQAHNIRQAVQEYLPPMRQQTR